MSRYLKLLITVIIIFFSSALEADDSFTPWSFTRQEIESISPKEELSIPGVILKNGIIFFSKYISPVDGDRCNMYPTCAAYSRQAIEKHGFVFGMLLTADRLIHEANETDSAPLVRIYDRLRYLDPVSNNDFWWK